MEEYGQESKIYVFREGLELFHITPIKTDDPDQVEERPWMEDVPIGDYTYNLDGEMFFGLSEKLTIYYDSMTEGEWNCAHLATSTTSILKLIDYGADKPMWDEEENIRLQDLGIDGWVAYDDCNDSFREVLLFHPRGKIGPFQELDHGDVPPVEGDYMWKHIDQLNLNKRCIGVYHIEDLVVN